ncbi:ELMO domain-containing protein 2 [Schistocerca cancellata]|uniref:ELMO domain-containing protein 2 n=1 Tax=Schistocerca cancellata TaxID=274614 RepID=UPI00211930EB|nr:ELMO domain-containing protein 2 [Schistocerca cancellata]
MFRSMWTYIYWLLRPAVKWILRKTTKLCELQRICYGEKPGASRAHGVEFSLRYSRSQSIRKLLDVLDRQCDSKLFITERKSLVPFAVNTVASAKEINLHIHRQFIKSFSTCIEQIWGYRELIHHVESLRKTWYDASNLDHERKLLRLWQLLMPDKPLESRVTKQWQDIGFQGEDPKTDFRGMGLLGLENLIYFAQEYPGAACHVLSHSHHPRYGYAFAIVGINLTSMAYHMLKDGTAKTHFFNVTRGCPAISSFHQFYCFLFYEFDRFWIESKPENVMDFARIKERFESAIRTSLTNPSTIFRLNISVDNI